MQTVFDPGIVDSCLSTAQLSQADVARELGLSREAVSNWMSGESVPRPRHRALLAALLGVSVSALAGASSQSAEPVVAYRRKGTRKVSEAQDELIKREVRWLNALEKRMSEANWIDRLPEHRGEPTVEHARVLAQQFRTQLGHAIQDEVLLGHHVIEWLSSRAVCIVPTFWGAPEYAMHAMYVRLPDSEVHWLFVSLDAAVVDVRFWLLHEVAHMIRRRPHDGGRQEEKFADAFAAEVLFPFADARRFAGILATHSDGEKIDMIKKLAAARIISPATVYLQVNHVLEAESKALLALDAPIFQATQRLTRGGAKWADGLFGGIVPTAKEFIETCVAKLGTPVFRLAAREIVENNRGPGFVERVLQCGSADAMALHEALREYGATDDPR
ncbi:MAG: helix-turn-helix transcriptional regulator [Bacteroidetes bacterium]|nr:helix-turn-helix transcriptional regulator [Bacteroidota bacterium]